MLIIKNRLLYYYVTTVHHTKSTTLDFKTNIWTACYIYPIPVYIIVNSLVAPRHKKGTSSILVYLQWDAHNSSQLSNKGHQSLMRGKRKLIFRVQWVITLLIIISLIPELNWVNYTWKQHIAWWLHKVFR